MDYLRSYNSDINSALSPLENPGVAAVLRLFLVLYGGLAAPHLPNSVLKWFDFVPFKLLVLFLIVWSANHDPAIAILIAVGFFVSMNTLSGKQMFEKFSPETRTYDY